MSDPERDAVQPPAADVSQTDLATGEPAADAAPAAVPDVPAAPPVVSPTEVNDTAGAMLRAAREAAGLHIAALAVSLKVPVRKLEALESDQYDKLPDAVFVRALAGSVCRALKVDPAPILARLPNGSTPRLAQDDGGLNAPFRSPRDGPAPSLLDQVSRPAVLSVLALLLAALVIALLPSTRPAEPVAVVSPPAAPAVATPAPADTAVTAAPMPAADGLAPAASSPAGAGTGTLATSAAITPAAGTAAPGVLPTVAVAAAKSTPTVPTPTLVVTPAAPAVSAASVAAGGEGLLVFRATGSSWIEVTDSRGQIPLRRTLEAGEVIAVSGALPLAVVVGRVDQTQVTVRGRRFDLSTVAKDNVARFEVR